MKLIQEKVDHGRARTAIVLLIVILFLSIVATLSIVYLMNFFTDL
jgi:hypothetical protein